MKIQFKHEDMFMNNKNVNNTINSETNCIVDSLFEN